MRLKAAYLLVAGVVIVIGSVLIIGWPEEDLPSGQTMSISTSSENLSRMPAPTFLLTISAVDTNALLLEAITQIQKTEKLPLEVTEPVFELVDQGIGLEADLTGKLPQTETAISGTVDGVVTVSIEGTKVVLRPALQTVLLKEINGQNVGWIPDIVMRFLKRTFLRGANSAINASLAQINAQIKAIIQPINIQPVGTLDDPGEPFKIPVNNRIVELPAPILASTTILIDESGVQVMGQLLTPDQALPESAGASTDEFEQYQKQFYDVASIAFDHAIDSFGKTGISLSESFFTDYFSLLPGTSIEDNQRNSVAQSSVAFSRIDDPTFLATISADDTAQLVDSQLQGILSDIQLPIEFEANPTITLANQGVAISAPIKHTLEEHQISLTGQIEGRVNVSVEGTNIILRPGFQSIMIDKLDGLELSALPLDRPVDLLSSLVVASNQILSASVTQINAQIEPITQTIDIQPLGTLDQPGEPIRFSLDEIDYELPAPILAASAILIDVQGIHVMGQLIEEGDLPPETNSEQTDDFVAYQKRYIDKAVDGLDIDSRVFERTGLTLSETFLRKYLDVLPRVSPEQRRREAILQTAKTFNSIRGPDIGIALSANLVINTIQNEIDQRLPDLNIEDINISSIDIQLGNQEILANASFIADLPETLLEYDLRLTGVINGSIALFTTPDNSLFAAPSFTNIQLNRIENLNESDSVIDISGMTQAINTILRSGLDNLNASAPLMQTKVITMELPIIDTVSLTDVMEDSPELSITPDHITPPLSQLASTTILIDQSMIQIMADINVTGLPERELIQPIADLEQLEVDQAHIQLFDKYQTVWMDAFGNHDLTSSALAAISKQRLGEFLNLTWTSTADLQAIYTLNKESFPLESTELRLTEKPTMNCFDVRSCSRRQCPAESTCVREECSRRSCDLSCGLDPGDCSRDCSTEICVRNPFNGRRVCTSGPNDPVCLAEVEICKAAAKLHLDCRARELGCNADANADYAACQAKSTTNYNICIGKIKTCNVDAHANYAACQTSQGIEELACNVAREWQNWAGDVGNISGDADASGNVAINLNSLEISPDFSQVTFQPRVSGSVDVSGKLNFTPYDIGHILVCPWKGSIDYATKIALPEQEPNVDAQISVTSPEASISDSDEVALEIEINVSEFPLDIKMDPPPWKAVLEQNPQALLVCQPALLLNVLPFITLAGEAVALAPTDIQTMFGEAGEVLNGQITYNVPEQTYRIPVPAIDLTLPDNQSWKLIPGWSNKAILFTLSEN